MKTKSTFLLITFLLFYMAAGAQSTPTEITAEYGPPAEANVWTHYSIPLTAETFNIDESIFDAVLAGVTSFWIRTEMHTGNDIGGIDDVLIGNAYSSYFVGSSEGWSSGGDGTMEWIPTGGYDGGFLQISDWATGDWHWLIAPSTWAGDWTSLKGQNIQFWYKTDRPSYAAIIKITTGQIDRLVINTPVSPTILPDDSVLIQLEVLPAPETDITVSFSTSDASCIDVPDDITVLAGQSSANVYFRATQDAAIGCIAVIEATCEGYLTSRITMQVLDNYGIEEINLTEAIRTFPNPCDGKFTLSNTSGTSIQQVILYDLSGNAVLQLQESDLSNTVIDVTNLVSGMYFLRVLAEGNSITSKIVIE